MNVSLMSIGADTYKKGSVFVGGLPMLQNNGLKSTQEKLERQQQAQNEVSFWEKQKDSLKNMECETPEEIAKKLEALHSYEDEIAAAKKAFNNEQTKKRVHWTKCSRKSPTWWRRQRNLSRMQPRCWKKWRR